MPKLREARLLGTLRRMRVELPLDLVVGVREVVDVQLEEEAAGEVGPPGEVPLDDQGPAHGKEGRPDLRTARGHEGPYAVRLKTIHGPSRGTGDSRDADADDVGVAEEDRAGDL